LEEFEEFVKLLQPLITVAMTGIWCMVPENVECQTHKNIQRCWELAGTNKELKPIAPSGGDAGFAEIPHNARDAWKSTRRRNSGTDNGT